MLPVTRATSPCQRCASHSRVVARVTIELQLQFPRLRDQLRSEQIIRLLLDQPEAGILVNPPRGVQDAVGPQNDLSISRPPRESDASMDQLSSDAMAALIGLDVEQPQLRRRLRLL